MEFDLIPNGEYEVVIATAEDAIVTVGFTRRFGAQLIRAADIHDRIQDAGAR